MRSIKSSNLFCSVSTMSTDMKRCVSSKLRRMNFLPNACFSSRCSRNCFIAGSLKAHSRNEKKKKTINDTMRLVHRNTNDAIHMTENQRKFRFEFVLPCNQYTFHTVNHAFLSKNSSTSEFSIEKIFNIFAMQSVRHKIICLMIRKYYFVCQCFAAHIIVVWRCTTCMDFEPTPHNSLAL